MTDKNRDPIAERIFIITPKEFKQPDDLGVLSKFVDFCKSRGLIFDKRCRWHLDYDDQEDIPQIKKSSFREVEYHFKCLGKVSSDDVKFVFRIMRDRIIFNFLHGDSDSDTDLQSAIMEFKALWKAFSKANLIGGRCKISLCYIVDLNQNTLIKDKTLFRTDWLEVKEISPLFGKLNPFPFECKYTAPFSCCQEWIAECPRLGTCTLVSSVESIRKDNVLTLRFLLENDTEMECCLVEKADWTDLFNNLSILRDVVLEKKAINAIKEYWK